MSKIYKPLSGDYVVVRWPDEHEMDGWGSPLLDFWHAMLEKPEDEDISDMLLGLKRQGKIHRGDYPEMYLASLALKGVIVRVR